MAGRVGRAARLGMTHRYDMNCFNSHKLPIMDYLIQLNLGLTLKI